MTRVTVAPGFALNVEAGGSGPQLVLLHGFTGSAKGWGEFRDLLQRDFTTIAIDIVGHGQSDAPEGIERYRMAQAVDDLAQAVEQAGVRRATWLGYSMGGRTALQVAAARPKAVERLVLIGGSPGLATAAERAARCTSDEALAERIEREGVAAFVDYWENIPLFASQRRLPPELREAIRRGRLACDATGLANSLRGMGTGAQASLWGQLASIEMPALLLAGELDAKFTAIGREMAGAMPCARFEGIPAAGHAAQIEEPEACARSVRTFFQEQRAPQGVLQ